MEDMATGEIRLSVLWEWLHTGAPLSDDDPGTGARQGEPFGPDLCRRLLEEEYGKLLAARDRDVHDDSKTTTLPIARAIAAAYLDSPVKPPWYVDLLNLALGVADLATARARFERYLQAFARDGSRLTQVPEG
jgi:malate synthase